MGNSYRLDTNYDRYASLDVFKRLTALAQRANIGCYVNYSAMTRGYVCELRQFEPKFRHQTSQHIYYTNIGHKYADDPLTAVVLALQQCLEPTPLLEVLCLEAHCILLGMEFVARRDLEKRLDKVLDDLAALIAKVQQPTWDEVFSDLEKTAHGSYVDRAGIERAKKQASGNTSKDRDFGDEYRRWSNVIAGKPAKPDLDDDL